MKSEIFAFSRDQLYAILIGAAELAQEYEKVHGHSLISAQQRAAGDTIEGVLAERELVEQGELDAAKAKQLYGALVLSAGDLFDLLMRACTLAHENFDNGVKFLSFEHAATSACTEVLHDTVIAECENDDKLAIDWRALYMGALAALKESQEQVVRLDEVVKGQKVEIADLAVEVDGERKRSLAARCHGLDAEQWHAQYSQATSLLEKERADRRAESMRNGATMCELQRKLDAGLYEIQRLRARIADLVRVKARLMSERDQALHESERKHPVPLAYMGHDIFEWRDMYNCVLDSMQSERLKHKRELDEVRTERDAGLKEIERLRADIADLVRRKAKLMSERDAAHTEIAKLRTAQEVHGGEVLGAGAQEWYDRYVIESDRVVALTNELAEAKTEIEGVEKDLATARASLKRVNAGDILRTLDKIQRNVESILSKLDGSPF